MFCYFFPFSKVIVQVQKSQITVEVSILKLNSGTGVAIFFCSENEKWAIIQELFNIIDFLVNSGLSGRGPA